MAKITDTTFREWHDTEIVNASEYTRERELLRVANNDNDARISSIEESIIGFQLGTAQLSKITTDEGGVKISVNSVGGSVLSEIQKAGQGMHTFYAASGSIGLPPTNLSIRGIAHMTSSDIGWVYATDYKNNIFTNYRDSSGWNGWRALISYSTDASRVASALNGMKDTGFFYVNAGTSNTPSANSGHLIVSSLNPFKSFVAQMFIDTETALVYTRVTNDAANSWYPWKRMVSDADTQDVLWDGGSTGMFMQNGQVVTPIKKISQCRNGWILVWSDYNPGDGAQGYDVVETYISKGAVAKFPGAGRPITVERTPDASIIKYLNIGDTKIEGNAGNEVGDKGDVVLRYVLEW